MIEKKVELEENIEEIPMDMTNYNLKIENEFDDKSPKMYKKTIKNIFYKSNRISFFPDRG